MSMTSRTRRLVVPGLVAAVAGSFIVSAPAAMGSPDPNTVHPTSPHHNEASVNKAAAIDAYARLFAGDGSAVDQYFARDFINHNPLAPRDAFTGYKDLAAAFANVHFRLWEPLRVVADGDYVGIQGLYQFDSMTTFRPTQSGPGVVGFDLFRFDHGKIVEHWDALQDVVPPSQTPDNNDMIGGGAGIPGHRAINPKKVVHTVVQISQGRTDHIRSRFSPDYINHNPYGTDGWAGVQSLAQAFGTAGFQMYTPHRWFADGNLVVLQGIFHLHSTSAFTPDRTGPGVVAFDIFRIGDNGKIVEHSDILQNNVPAASTVSGLPTI